MPLYSTGLRSKFSVKSTLRLPYREKIFVEWKFSFVSLCTKFTENKKIMKFKKV